MASKGANSNPAAAINFVTAVRQKRLNTANGKFSAPDGANLSITDAVAKGLLTVGAEQNPAEGITLCDALRQGLVEARTGRVMDRYSGKQIKVNEAVARGIINPDRLEIYDAKKKEKITLKEALTRNVIDDASGKYVNEKSEKISFGEALKKNLICNPMTLKECDDNDLIDKQNKLKDPINNFANMNILEAIGYEMADFRIRAECYGSAVPRDRIYFVAVDKTQLGARTMNHPTHWVERMHTVVNTTAAFAALAWGCRRSRLQVSGRSTALSS